VLFVTHEINAVLPYADRVLYLANGQFRLGTPDEVITTASLSALYGSPVEVLRFGGRVAILAATSGDHSAWEADDPAPADRRSGT
jgi:zinc/manganese transport system ATP-binding protein